MSYSPPTRSVAEVTRAVKRTFGDESGAQLEDADIIAWINDAQDEINNKNKILKEQADVAISGSDSYTFPSKRIQQIEALLVDGVPVKNISYGQALESYIGKVTSTAAAPLIWYEWGGRFTLYPNPTSGTVTLLYTVRPQPVTSMASMLSVPDKYYQDVIRYVLQQAFLMDEALDLSSSQAQQFQASLDEKSEEEREAQHMTYPVITVMDDYGEYI